jgi:hypothetical protein
MSSHLCRSALAGLILVAAVSPVSAQVQTMGTLSWKMEPYCNTLTLTVVQDPAGIRLQGTEDLCDAIYAPQAVEGTAVLGAGMAHIGLNTGVPGGFSVEGNRVVAAIDTATLNGTWSDDAGRVGTLVRVTATRHAGTQRGGAAQTWLHIVTTSNRTGGTNNNVSCFSHPMTDGNPNALVIFTHNRGPQTAIRPLVGSVVSLYYDDNGTGLPAPLTNNVWCLSRNDSADMPLGAGFTIRVVTR